jgi:hypothetical protein
MKRCLLLTFFITSLSYAQKPPEWWCRSEPVSLNGDEYLRYGLTSEEACAKALKDCEEHYKNCTITGCGEWLVGRDVLEGSCDEMYPLSIP